MTTLPHEAVRLLQALFEAVPDDLYVEVRTIASDGAVAQRFHRLKDLRGLGFDRAVPTGANGRVNVYFGVLPRERQSGTAEDVVRATCCWTDQDHGLPEPWPKTVPPPSIVVETSPGKAQFYWLLSKPAGDLAAVEGLNRRLARALGGDSAACDRARVLRMPGFLNLKYPERPMARLVTLDAKLRYSLNALDAAVPQAPPSAKGGKARLTPGELSRLEAGVAEGQRHHALSQLVGHHCAHGLNRDEILSLVSAWNTRNQPPLDDEELTKQLEDMFARWGDQSEPRGARKSQATRVAELGADLELLHSPDGDGYVGIPVEGHIETYPLRSRQFTLWLTRSFFEHYGKTPSAAALNDGLAVLEGRALFEGGAIQVYRRLARLGDTIYLDLGNPAWEVVEIAGSGWQVKQGTDLPMNIKFSRTPGTQPLPTPSPRGSIEELRPFVNVTTEDWPLLVGALIGMFNPDGPFFILVLNGEAGSAKSTTARVLRALVDPNVAALRAEPRDERDLVIAASNTWIVALDNLSRIPPWLSDALCRLSTGGGFATRELYTNRSEAIFNSTRPVILTSIEHLAVRGDLVDRSLSLTLPQIAEDRRRPEAELWSAFGKAAPRILGALLDAVATALRELPALRARRFSLPRMADAALWAMAAEPALGLAPGSFLEAYSDSRQHADAIVLESSAIAKMLETLVTKEAWSGTPTALFDTLNGLADDSTRGRRSWPKTTKALRNQLLRLAPSLRSAGIEVEFSRTASRRLVTIKKIGPKFVTPVTSVIADTGAYVGGGASDPSSARGDLSSAQIRRDTYDACDGSKPQFTHDDEGRV